MHENILSDLASLAATDPGFLRRARKDLEGTLARNGYHLTAEELRVVEDLRRRTAGMSDKELARVLAGGLQGVAVVLPPVRRSRVGAERAQQDRRALGPDGSG
jgi:hypothetical protein